MQKKNYYLYKGYGNFASFLIKAVKANSDFK